MAVWSPEAVAEFIHLYREHPCLWKIKCKDYSSRAMRNVAYDELVEFCKEIGFGSATREFVFKKIQNLRGAFRKELKKVIDAREKNNEVYKPNLWYFDLLLFTQDQELEECGGGQGPGPSEDSLECEGGAGAGEQVVSVTWLPQPASPRDRGPGPPAPGPAEACVSPPLPTPPEHLPLEVVEDTTPVRTLKRKRSDIDPQIKLMNVCLEALKRTEVSEFEGFAVCVAKKLEKMSSTQALYAESLIHTVLRRGIFNQLTETTDICDLQCNKRVNNRIASALPSSPAHIETAFIKQEAPSTDS